MTYPVLIQEIEDYLGIKKADLKRDGEQVIGQYRPDLIMDADQDAAGDTEALKRGQNPRICYQEPQKALIRYDQHNYQAQGETVPPEPIGRPSPFTGLVSLVGLVSPLVCVGLAVWFWATMWPDSLAWFLRAIGR